MCLRNPSFWQGLGRLAAFCTVLSLFVAVYQLYGLSRDQKLSRANDAVQHFLTSSDMLGIANIIKSKTQQGKDYTTADSDTELETNLNHYMNALEAIATGINKGFYNESLICHNLAHIIFKQVKAQLLGESGRLPSGHQWVTDQALYPSDDFFPELRALFKNWFPSGELRECKF